MEFEWLSRLGQDGQAFVLLYQLIIGCEFLKEGKEQSTTPYKFITIHCVQKKKKKKKSLSFPSCYRRNTSRFLSMVLMMLEIWFHPHGKRSNRKTLDFYWHFRTLLEQRHNGSVSVNLNLMRFFTVAIVFNLKRFTNILLRKEKPRIVKSHMLGWFLLFFLF